MKQTLLKHIVSAWTARENCQRTGNTDRADKWTDILDQAEKLLPSGSGYPNYDAGTKLEDYTDDILILSTSYHHMNEMGGYDGWTDHEIGIAPHLLFGFTVDVSGEDKNGIKEMIRDDFYSDLQDEYELTADMKLIPAS